MTQTTHRAAAAALGCIVFANAATAQSFNVDAGLIGAPPSATYGAAASQPGTWNQVLSAQVAQPLNGLAGSPTAVTISTGALGDFYFLNLGPTGDAALLMNDYNDGAQMVVVSGLAAGSYTVYTYAWAPDSAVFVSNVSVLGSVDPLQTCGGAWPGMQQLGVTYTRHTVVVNGANPDLIIDITINTTFATLNGIQIVAGAPGSLGTSYCGPAVPNTTGSSAVITAAGSVSAAANNLTLTASAMPANQFGFFLTSMTQGLVPMPGGSQGNLCLSGTIGRYVAAGQIMNGGANGTFSLLLNLTQTPAGPVFVAVTAGQTWNFQAWFRDIGPMGQPLSNFTDGRSITFN